MEVDLGSLNPDSSGPVESRERMGLSQEQFAEKAGIHRTYVSSVELGKVNLGIETANELALALGKRLSKLVEEAE